MLVNCTFQVPTFAKPTLVGYWGPLTITFRSKPLYILRIFFHLSKESEQFLLSGHSCPKFKRKKKKNFEQIWGMDGFVKLWMCEGQRRLRVHPNTAAASSLAHQFTFSSTVQPDRVFPWCVIVFALRNILLSTIKWGHQMGPTMYGIFSFHS